MTLDPKWLAEILKASGWQTAALALALGIFLLLPRLGFLAPQEPWVTTLAVLAFLAFAFLAVASIAHAAADFFQPKAWLAHWIKEKQQRRRIRKYIPHMTDEEKKIIGYLLAKNQKMITAAQDGGHAATLISQGILVLSMRSGQYANQFAVPFRVPDHVWDELQAQKELFPYKPTPKRRGEVELEPWRVPWMAQ